MFGFDTLFDSPWYLLLLVLLPVLWLFSFQSLSGLGPCRRWFALGFRTVVLVLLILSLAEMQSIRKNDKLTVIYLLDQSHSIPIEQRQAMLTYVEEEVRRHRNDRREDMAGVIAFGRDAAIEVPPFDDELATTGRIESLLELRQDATNLEGAMKLALSTFPENSAKRVVIVTDGNENVGNAQEMADVLVERDVSIYIVPVHIERSGEVAVEKVAIPSDVRKGQPFNVRVVLSNQSETMVRGKLMLYRKRGQRVEPQETAVVLSPGKTVFTLPEEIDRPDFYTYEAEFVPERGEDDLMPQNNRASAFTHIRGQGHVLLIEDWENPGEYDFLVDRLRAMNLEVTVQKSDELFSSLADLQRFDTVVLANVPRTSGSTADSVTNFNESQIEMLVHNVKNMGAGLVMIGGPRSFGAGGWQNTELEKAMPVDFHILNAKVVPVGALVLTMHASEMARGNHWQKVIGREALKALGPQDYCGVISYGAGGDQWLWNQPDGLIKVGNNRNKMLAQLSRMQPGDMPDFEPGMRLAAAAFAKISNAGVRHMILISDGDPSPPTPTAINRLKKLNVKVTTVAVGTHGPAGSTPLQRIATQTGGKYYVVTNPRALPRIYQREARKISRPLVKEKRVNPQIVYRHEILRGIESAPPPINGFVLTTVKDNPLVEVSIRSPDPPTSKHATVLASWTYELGRTVALTTDAGQRWATDWVDWEYDKLFSQIVRWSMRPLVDEGQFTVATDVNQGAVKVVVTALDKNDDLLNYLHITGSAIDPGMRSMDFDLEQMSPGRYVGEFGTERAGSYFMTLSIPNPNGSHDDSRPITIRTGVNVPYSSEFRDQESNLALMESLAIRTPRRGGTGRMIAGSLTEGGVSQLLETDTFLHDLAKAVGRRDIWPWLLVVASCTFLGDVFVRRVTVHFYWTLPLLAAVRDRVLRREAAPVLVQRLERLRSRKEGVVQEIDERRATARFQPLSDDPAGMEILDDPSGAESPTTLRPQTSAGVSETQPEEETYTERLLKAKQKVWKDRDK